MALIPLAGKGLISLEMNGVLDLGLNGTTVDDVLIEYSVTIQLSDLSVIVVESPLAIQNRAGSAHFTPDSDSDTALQPIQLLVSRTIEAATPTTLAASESASPTGPSSVSMPTTLTKHGPCRGRMAA